LVPFLLTVGFAVLLLAGALSPVRAVGIWLLCLAAFFLVRFVRDVRSADAEALSRRFDAALRGRKEKVSVPGELLRMERVLGLGIATAADGHRLLLPLLRTAAAARLASSYGIDLMRSPAAARARLGDEAWDWLRPDRPAPEDRHAPGVPRDVAARLIAQVEGL
jgi:Ca2+/Na+ antiporter